MSRDFPFDALLPAEMAAKAAEIGVRKVRLDAARTVVLAVLAGAFIALGAALSTTVATGTANAPYGWSRLLAGLSFSVGLMFVTVGGAELFTGNNLIVMAWASGKVTTRQLWTNWTLVYSGNLFGAVATAVLLYAGGQYLGAGGSVGASALSIANAKTALPFGRAVVLGVLCNVLVCLAVWLSLSARTTTDRILSVFPPITAFVTMGFEHSIANMYFIPVGLMIRGSAPDSFWQAIGRTSSDYPDLSFPNFLWGNLLPVTLGNMIGGVLLVGLVYWFVYLRGEKA